VLDDACSEAPSTLVTIFSFIMGDIRNIDRIWRMMRSFLLKENDLFILNLDCTTVVLLS
jgi:hypothetical protein